MNRKKAISIPKSTARRLLQRCARNEPFVVVPSNGEPVRFFGLDEYQKIRQQPQKHKYWKRRTSARKEAPDPLGAIPGEIVSLLRRQDIYD